MPQQDQITNDKVVTFHYRLSTTTGEEIESSFGDEPLLYLQGAGQIVPGLEKAMMGKKKGDKFRAEVSPDEGYGEKSELKPMPVERSAFPEDAHLEVGMDFMAEMPDGNFMPLWISSIEGDTIMVDSNHPLAGETLFFDIEVLDIRDATEEELDHGHAHGPGGHHH